MPGIVVGVDSSLHAKLALEWAMKEAAVRDTPLTVLAVHKAVAGFYSSGVAYPGDDALTEKVGQAAQADVDAVAATLGDAAPKSVTVLAVNGVPAEALIKASVTLTCSSSAPVELAGLPSSGSARSARR
jgi:nucleotide-binding universal stress UspA family protein